MRFVIILIPFNLIFSQKDCCGIKRLKKGKPCFITKYNSDSTNNCLVAIDTITQNHLFEYCYEEENPLLNLKGDYFDDAYRTKRQAFLKNIKIFNFKEFSSKPNRVDSTSSKPIRKDSSSNKKPKYFVGNYLLWKSKYEFRDFDLDSINVKFKALIEYFDFPYCEDYLDIRTNSKTLLTKENTLQSILTNKVSRQSNNFAIIQNIIKLQSCSSRRVERKLDVITSNGEFYSIVEKFKLNENPKFSFTRAFEGWLSKKDFDIVKSKTNTFLITYVDKKINIHDLRNERLLKSFNTERNIPYPYKAIKVNDNIIAFIPEPNRLGYDWKNSKYGIIRGIDLTSLMDYDDTVKKVYIVNLKKDKVYYKEMRVDKIEKISGFKNLNVLFNDERTENVRKWSEVEN